MTNKLIDKILQERYQIQSILGHQTGRRTYLAKDLQTQSQVVVKLLLFNPDFTWDDLKLFEREAETLRNLAHPAIPQYLDYFEVETEIGKGSALIQSYIEAKSLQDWVESGRSFSEAELKAIATQLLEVIQYLHSHLPPVIHRDIKPSNILLTDRSGNSPGTVYLVDFGSVQTVVHSGTITIVGTYGYMPPEQFGGKTTPASDLYSLGATLIYLITRSHPADLPTRRGRIQFEVNSQISSRFQAWIKYLIQPDLEQRFNTAEKASLTLQNDALALDGFPITHAKPHGSRVSFKKTDEQLEIIVPSSQLKAIFGTILGAVMLCVPQLIVFLMTNSSTVREVTVVITVAVVLLMLIYTINNYFKEIQQILIDHENIIYINHFLGVKSQKSSPIKDITKLEKSWESINIWIKKHCYYIKPLTSMEVEWLTHEIGNWLDLPIQQSYELTKINLIGTSRSNPVDFSRLSTMKAPSQPECHIDKTDNILEISAPAQSYSGCFGYFFGCLMTLSIFILFIIVGAAVGLTAAFVLGIITIAAITPALASSNSTQNQQEDRIILRIAQDTACLYNSSYPEEYLNQTYTKNIRNIEVVYYSSRPNSYHVELQTDYYVESKIGFREKLLVGQRQHWLSEQEAYWLAKELSQWLKVPVTEREEVETATC